MGNKELFPKLSLEEKRQVLNLNEWYLSTVLSARQGKPISVINLGVDYDFLERMSDSEIEEALELIRLCAKAGAATDPKESIRLYKKIIAKAPFDSISMLSIGVCYANLGKGKKAVKYVEEALKSDPNNQRIRDNLAGIKRHFGM